MTKPTPIQVRRVYFSVMYCGPWEYVFNALWGVRPKSRREVKDGSLRDRLAERFETLDQRWREKYIVRGINPPERWERRPKRKRP